MNKERMLAVYALSICFACTLCGAVAFGFFSYNAIKWAAPRLAIDPITLSHLESAQSFRTSHFYQIQIAALSVAAHGAPAFMPLADPIAPRVNAELKPPSEEEVERMRQRQLAQLLGTQKHMATQGLLMQTIVLLIAAALFWVHWRIAQAMLR